MIAASDPVTLKIRTEGNRDIVVSGKLVFLREVGTARLEVVELPAGKVCGIFRINGGDGVHMIGHPTKPGDGENS
jgi:hypothetical protein